MGFFSKFEGRMEDAFEGVADHMANSPISPVQIAKKAEKQMRREKMVGAGKQYAPTLYTVLVNPDDDRRLFGYYPTLAGETETYLAAKAAEEGLVMDGEPLVRFIVDESLKHGKFDIIAEAVAAPIVAQLRAEEMQRYGLASAPQDYSAQEMPVYNAAMSEYSYAQSYSQPSAAPYETPVQTYNDYNDFNAHRQNDQHPFEHPFENAFNESQFPYKNADKNTFNEYNADATPLPNNHVANPFDMAQIGMDCNMAATESEAAAASHTVVFAGNQRAAACVPAHELVHARLVNTATNRAYDLASSRLTIGRESKNNIAVRDLNVSRMHAELRLEPQGVWVITDLGSTNGTFVNGHEISSQPLVKGDLITVGTTNFIFTQA